MNEREQVPVTPEYVSAILAAVSSKGVLVGGQALAVWLGIFDLDDRGEGAAPVSIDADFLGDHELVDVIHQAMPGSTATHQLRSAISRLVGVVELPIADDKFMAVDIIDRVPPLTEEHVFERAIPMIGEDEVTWLVLHPVDLLTSRAYNLRKFKEKQTPHGVEQLRLAMKVVFRYLSDALEHSERERPVLNIFEEIVRLAKSSNGATAKAYGLDFRTALPFDLIKNETFQLMRRPQIERALDSVIPPAYLPVEGRGSDDESPSKLGA